MEKQKKSRRGLYILILIIVTVIAMVVAFSGEDTGTDYFSNPVYKIEFTDGSNFHAKDFSRIDAKGSGGDGCVEFVAMTEYVSDSGKITKEGEIMFHCGTYTFSPPYVEGGY